MLIYIRRFWIRQLSSDGVFRDGPHTGGTCQLLSPQLTDTISITGWVGR